MTIDAILEERFRTSPERFRRLGDKEYPIAGDLAVRDGIPKYCDGPFYRTVSGMRRLTRDESLEYHRAL